MATDADKEAVFGIVPVLKTEKNYGFWDVFLVTGGYAIATWCYTQGAYMAEGLGFRQLLCSIFGPNLIIIALISLPAIFAVRYGIDTWVWLRVVFGTAGSRFACIAFLVMNLPWFAVCANMFAESMIRLLAYFGIELPQVMYPLLSLFCVLGGLLIALGGPGAIKWVSRIMVTALLAVGVIAIFIIFTAVPVKDIISFAPRESLENNAGVYALMIEASTAFAISWCLALAVIPRLCKSERSGYWATAASYGLVAPFFVFIGAIMAIAMFMKTGAFSDDPTEIFAVLSGPSMALLSLIMVAFANIGTAGCGTYINSLVLKSSFPKIKFVWLAILLSAYMGSLALWGGVTEYFGAFISYSAFVLAPISGMLIVNLFIVGRQKVSLRSLYNDKDYKGVNPVGIVCLVLGFLSGALVYNPATGEILSPLFYFTTASGLSFFTGGLTYLIASRIPGIRRYMYV